MITFLQSVLQVTPILYVQYGQTFAGAIDYNMRASADSARNKGNQNYYAQNPFETVDIEEPKNSIN